MFNKYIVVGIVLLFAGCNKPQQSGKAELEGKNKAQVMKFYTEVLDNKNMKMIDELIAPNAIDHQLPPGYPAGIEGVRKMLNEYLTAFPDMKNSIDYILCDSDKVAIGTTMTGTQTGAMMGMQASGKKVNVQGVDVIRLVDGKMVEHWGFAEEMKMMQQLGAMPPMGEPGKQGEMKEGEKH